jgi:hypothetical protein
MAFAAGLVIAVLDQASDTRGTMWISLVATSALFAWWRPAAAWRWGLLLAIGIPCLAAVSDTRSPYVFDRADAMYGTPPAILTAVVVAHLQRYFRRTSSRSRGFASPLARAAQTRSLR